MEQFVRIPRRLLAARPSVLAIFAALTAMSDDAGGAVIEVGYFDLAMRCGVAVRTARCAVAQLASGGYVERRGRMKWGVRLLMTVAAGNDATADVGLNAVSDVKADGVGIAVDNAALNATLKTTITPLNADISEDSCHSQCHTECRIDDGAKENEKEKEQKEKDKEENSLSSGVRTYTHTQEKRETSAVGDESMSLSDWAGVFVDPPNDWREVVKIAPVYTGRAWTEQMARAFIAHYASMGWRTAGGGLIRDWRQRLAKWLLSENTPHIGMRGQYNGARRGAMALDRYEPGF